MRSQLPEQQEPKDAKQDSGANEQATIPRIGQVPAPTGYRKSHGYFTTDQECVESDDKGGSVDRRRLPGTRQGGRTDGSPEKPWVGTENIDQRALPEVHMGGSIADCLRREAGVPGTADGLDTQVDNIESAHHSNDLFKQRGQCVEQEQRQHNNGSIADKRR